MQPWRVFDDAWFTRHQSTLLWLLRSPLIGRWLRWVLAITSNDVGHRKPIVRLLPHAYIVRDGDQFTADFRTHAKFAKRLYFAFKPFWWALHYWDTLVANPLVPALNAGFDLLTQYPDAGTGATTTDGRVGWGSGGPGGELQYAQARAAIGNDATPASAEQVFGYFQWGQNLNGISWIIRYLCTFQTSVIGGATVSAASLSLWGTTGGTNLLAEPLDLNVYQSKLGASASAPNQCVAADYNLENWGATALCDTPFVFASTWMVGAYNTFVLNSAGLAAINKTGVSSLGTRLVRHDVNPTMPTGWNVNQNGYFWGYHADQTGTTNDPKLVVTYVNSIVLAAVATVAISASAAILLPRPLAAASTLSFAGFGRVTLLSPLLSDAMVSIGTQAALTAPAPLRAAASLTFSALGNIKITGNWQPYFFNPNATVSPLGPE